MVSSDACFKYWRGSTMSESLLKARDGGVTAGRQACRWQKPDQAGGAREFQVLGFETERGETPGYRSLAQARNSHHMQYGARSLKSLSRHWSRLETLAR